ncbi:PAS domain-containing sensor histidine kinase [Sorangium sp. So ce327]|uniref:PAS domain-containing sensor histidine kinase n=1 Tax=Sorangium sp. So ce327 TaxID=3133301 RepID=UPI003F5F7856
MNRLRKAKRPSERRAAPLGTDALLRRAAESSPLPTAFTGGPKHVVRYANQALCQLMQRSPEEMKGAPLVTLLQEAGALAEIEDRVHRSGITELASELVYPAAGGRTGHCFAVVCPVLDGRARSWGLCVRLVDTTAQVTARIELAQLAAEVRQANEALVLAGLREQQLAERATQLYQEAQTATRAREGLLAIVSHDLKAPLSAMIMSIELLRSAPVPDSSGRSRERLDVIQRCAEGMSRLIRDLLDAAAIEAGRLSVERRPVSLAPLVGDAVDAIRPLAAAKLLRLTSELAADLPAVSADPVRLQQVLSNLLENAVKFTPTHGEITVRARALGDEVMLSVTDTGLGIAQEDIPLIFDRFWQARPTARAGTGLGLSIAKGIVEAHDGRIWAESSVGRGSAFFVTLPIAAAPASGGG